MTTSNFFDELQHRWQQQPPAPDSPAGNWQALLASGSRSPVTRMIRHAWTELIIGTLISLPLLAALLQLPGSIAQGLALGLTGVGGLSLVYYYRQLALLQKLRTASDPLRSHTSGQLRQLRGLLRLGHHANLALTAILAALTLYAGMRYVLPALPAAATLSFLLWFALTAAASLALVHWLTKWSIRESYGQHLDRLEAVVRELDSE